MVQRASLAYEAFLKSFWCLRLLLVVVVWYATPTLQGQEFNSTNVSQLAPAPQRLMIEQVDELLLAGKFDEAISKLRVLIDEGADWLVPVGIPQRSRTLAVQRFIPLSQWAAAQLQYLVIGRPDVSQDASIVEYSQNASEAAQVVYRQLIESHDLNSVEQACRVYAATDLASQFQLLRSDLYLERGWTLAALDAAEAACPDLRSPIEKSSHNLPLYFSHSLPRYSSYHLVTDSVDQGVSNETLTSLENSPYLVQALRRQIIAAGFTPDLIDLTAIRDWTRDISSQLPSMLASQLEELLTLGESPKIHDSNIIRSGESKLNKRPIAPFTWPTWNQTLELHTITLDQTPASKPRIGESSRGATPYHVVVNQGIVFVNEMHRISAFELFNGNSWPDRRSHLPLFDLQMNPTSLTPLGYRQCGLPRGTLTVSNNCLYARMGSAVTGWANRDSDGNPNSRSFLVGLDLNQQGSLLHGFPLHLQPPHFINAEPEGCPIVADDKLLVTVLHRDNVGLHRSVAAFDRVDGRLIWKSSILGDGITPAIENANLVSHQLLSVAGGRVFYNTNLGVIACLSLEDGRTEWLTQYSTPKPEDSTSTRPRRYLYRDLNPCLIHQGLVLCAPQDCPEVFALDCSRGDLIWSTDENSAADAIHLLGVAENNVILSGDRLIWLDCQTGRPKASFPSSVTPGMLNALPHPRGLGRGAILDDRVYWPVSGEILVFSAATKPSRDPFLANPTLLRRLPLDSRGVGGGNITFSEDWLLYAGINRLMAFGPEP
ncbi:MAG: PQQ-like beta-propeller repeat protein [Planctomycetales bacterium]|nr:PQQ-like beta-propeller repeat protein [Planctomycetales bacterium]